MWCHKFFYHTRKQAKKAMKKLQMLYHRDVRTVYYCDECSGFHLTSQEKENSRNYTRHLRKNKL
jgi:hypothetical protein